MRRLNLKVVLSVWTYLGWFGCVYCGKLGWSAASLVFPAISWLLLRAVSGLNRGLLLRLLVLFCIGVTFDSIAVYVGIIQPTPPAEMGWLPLWLISLWLLFVSSLPLLQTMLQTSFRRQTPTKTLTRPSRSHVWRQSFLAAMLGAIFGPLSYRAGSQFDVLMMDGAFALVLYAIFWAVYIPGAIFWLAPKGKVNEDS